MNNKIRAAIVDDSDIIRQRLAEKIKNMEGYEICWEASDVPEAVLKFVDERPDVMILDIHMPSGSGITVLDKIKKEANKTVVIMLTNFAMHPFKKRCFEGGANYFFDKSTELEKVFDVLKSLRENNKCCKSIER